MRQAFVSAIAFVGFSASAFAEGNPVLGKKFFKKCVSRQAIEEGKRKLGPSLFGIVGRQAGNVEGFKYSKPMSAADFFWNEETLTGFLRTPKKFMKGTRMSFPGVTKDADMANVLAYLNTL